MNVSSENILSYSSESILSNAYAVISFLDKPYYLEFVDLVRFNSQGKIAQMKEFLDSGHIQKHVERHESEQAK